MRETTAREPLNFSGRLRGLAARGGGPIGSRTDRLRRLVAPIFAETAPAARSWPRLGMGALMVLFAAGVSLWREPGAGALNTVWAEDGTIFLSGAVNDSPAHALATSYGG